MGDERRSTFLEKLIPKNGICRHFSENTNDTASDVVGLEVCLIETVEASVDVWEISVDLLETASRAEVYAKDQNSASEG